ncbi:MAG: hypothetical protein LBV12_13100 [Puniceicoccales bacterium]|jgi:hypothetical protein|nr:hypothetical protein [Puniceicoccales bacterium]
MKIQTDRLVGAFALFFAAALPLLAGFVTFICFPTLVEIVGFSKGVTLPPISQFVFNNFKILLWTLFGLTLLLVLAGGWQMREKDVTHRLGYVLLVAVASAALSVIYLSVFILATTQPFVLK